MKKLIIANWKMNKLRREALDFARSMAAQENIHLAIVPSFLSIYELKQVCVSKNILVGSQNMSEFGHGAYTGEVSASMLKDVGCDFVLLGHSERRKIFLESNEVIAKKVERAIVEDMSFVLCVGETLDERELGETKEVIYSMLNEALSSLMDAHWKHVTIAYEPVWAIGTGKVASAEIISEVHDFIRSELEILAGDKASEIRILYGGSVKPDNIKEILTLRNVDGALVGGASLEALSFNELLSEVQV